MGYLKSVLTLELKDFGKSLNGLVMVTFHLLDIFGCQFQTASSPSEQKFSFF